MAGGGGGGKSAYFGQEWILKELFTVWKLRCLLLHLSGWLLLYRKDYLIALALAQTTVSPYRASDPVATPENFNTIGPGIWEEIANIHTDRHTDKSQIIVR